MRAAIAVGLLGACGLAGCFSSLQDDAGVQSQVGPTCVTANCRRGSGSASRGGSGSGSSSSSSISSSSGTTTVASSGGSSSGGTSSGSAGSIADGGPNCPQLYVTSTISDIAQMTPIAGATASAVGLDGVIIPGASATSDPNGHIAVCVPPNVEFSLQVTATGYPETILEDVILTKSEALSFGNVGGMPLLSDSDLVALNALLPYNTSKGTLLVSVNSFSKAPTCYDSAGWQLSIGFPDGGTLPDGGGLPYQKAYLNSAFLPDPTLQVTSTQGDAFFYDIDTSLTDRVAIVAVNTNSNSGTCVNISAQIGLQGTARVTAQALTFAPVLNP